MNPIKIVVLDDHQIVRDGISAMFIADKYIAVSGCVPDYDGLIKILNNQKIDIIILDISLPGKSGIEIANILKDTHKETRIIMLSANCDEENIIESVKAGANGFLHKDTSKAEFSEAIKLVHSGQEYFGAKLSKIIYSSYTQHVKKTQNNCDDDILTERETEIIKHLTDGRSSKEISEILYISPRTVESHKSNILKKLKLNNTAELIKYAIKNGIIRL